MIQPQEDNRNIKLYCLTCRNNKNCYFAKRVKNSLTLAICEDCYQKLSKDKDEYINMKDYRNYQLELLKISQPLLYYFSEISSKTYDNLILTDQQKSTFKEYNEKYNQIDKMLREVENGSSESILKLLFQFQETQDKFHYDLLILLKFEKQINLVEKIDINRFRNEQDIYFGHNFQNFLQKFLTKSMQNEINKKLQQIIGNCIDFPLFLHLVGDKFNDTSQSEFVKQNYYGYLNNENQKEGLGFWNSNNQLFYGIFYEDIFLWGIKVIIYSQTQFTLFKGFFSKCKEKDGQNYLLNGTGEMTSTDENWGWHEYQGGFRDEKRQGEGTYTWKSRDNKEAKYTGYWLNDQYHGQGTLVIPDQNITIEGEFNFGVPIYQSCEITGKDIPRQVLSNYLEQKNKQTIENKFPLQQQPQMKLNIDDIQKTQIFSTFSQSLTPQNQQTASTFQQTQQKINQTNQKHFLIKSTQNQPNQQQQ
ncbi:unnamed protein product (macronuclear) [Paramecium tetraurelia]|uniref:MORN repeat protein n=1 Tax=Paramecium tetraurelia TaxID=5888 RepID=A0DDN0_PARTE|nr:uncharacterized protein GSPATT00015988001 [Paramecium tetraurelia]CAK81147.1 unnamed protein product [Paramecium tetraurelia]|eukprot:XP_001448544.1 hypothetical protein (macronuclear) [Paramecium tetraurelia strain d4-2]